MQPNNNHLIPLLVVCGPTASGKSKLAVDLAKAFSGEVVSADSMQIYRQMNIGTAKPTPEEMQGIPHHLLDLIEPSQTFSLVEYLDMAHACIQDIHQNGHLPILAGGTGLYIHSLIDNIQFIDVPTDPVLRRSLEEQALMLGAQAMWEQLKQVDPLLAEKLHPNNQGRVIRALEVFQLTGIPMSQWQERSHQQASPYKPCIIGLTFEDRALLYQRINDRVDLMIASGLLDEAARLLQADNLSQTAAQAIGYKELFDYFNGIITKEQAVEEVKKQSRRYAKRQLTWLRRDSRVQWLCHDSFPSYNVLLEHALSIVTNTL